MVLKYIGWEIVDGVNLARIVTSGGLLWTCSWTCGFLKMWVVC